MVLLIFKEKENVTSLYGNWPLEIELKCGHSLIKYNSSTNSKHNVPL